MQISQKTENGSSSITGKSLLITRLKKGEVYQIAVVV